jgi:hypothetical protein
MSLMYATSGGVALSITPDTPLANTSPNFCIGTRGSPFGGARDEGLGRIECGSGDWDARRVECRDWAGGEGRNATENRERQLVVESRSLE